MNLLSRYARWLHTQWPAGTVEKLPVVNDDGTTNVPGVRVIGDLTGVPLLKFSADSGARAVLGIVAESGFQAGAGGHGVHDLVIIGGGVSGAAAALEAQRLGLDFVLLEASQSFATIKNFPQGKPIYTYPTDMTPAGALSFRHEVKEPLVDDLDAQLAAAGIAPTIGRAERVKRAGKLIEVPLAGGETLRAQRVIIGIGRSGNYRRLGVPGEDLDHVSNRLHDPKAFAGRSVLVVGGGDSAMEAVVALAAAGAAVTLSYRKGELTRPKPENVAQVQALAEAGSVTLALGTTVQGITAREVVLKGADGVSSAAIDDVFVMIGREAPLDFFRRSGVHVRGEWRAASWAGLVAFLAFCIWIYHWKSYNWTVDTINPARWWQSTVAQADPSSLLYTLARSASGPSFYYTLIYSAAIGWFGFKRIKRRKTPYVTRQTISLMFIQWLPLFILPEIILPWMGRNGFFIEGAALRPVADLFFETYDGGVGVERAYWRAYGFILAWPLMVYNWFTQQPMVGWLVLGGLQTFVLIPWMVRRWGKGAMCGWLCSCGALAETLGDTHRAKMPHGPKWNRLNLIGQVALVFALALLGLRIAGWLGAESVEALFADGLGVYKWTVDIFLGGILGVGLYFHFSGRVWCRFACPLAALMHIYARFSRFRIFADKKKCISCNVCTSVCHQGIDIMSFANKGLPMEDPECVRCSACVQSCPTGVLSFGRYGKDGAVVLDRTPASLVQMAEALKG